MKFGSGEIQESGMQCVRALVDREIARIAAFLSDGFVLLAICRGMRRALARGHDNYRIVSGSPDLVEVDGLGSSLLPYRAAPAKVRTNGTWIPTAEVVGVDAVKRRGRLQPSFDTTRHPASPYGT